MTITPKQERARRGELTDAHSDYNKGLNSYASQKLSNKSLGEDLVQDTFIKTWSYLVKRGKIDGMRAFLYHILNNLIIDEYRKRKYRPISLDTLLEDGYTPSVDDSVKLFNILDGKRVIPLIDKLPTIYQKVMKMRYIQDLTVKEIATLTGKSENIISVRIHRGVKRLRLLYEPIG